MRNWRLALGAAVVLAVVAALAAWLMIGGLCDQSLVILCAAGLKQPVEAIRQDDQQETGQTVLVQYGGSNTLLANLKLTGEADLFLPADDSYIELARRDNLVGQATPLARMRPVLVVKNDNPLGIKSLSDLLSGTARISIIYPEAAATGKLVREALTQAGQWDAFQSRVTVFKPTVTDVANDLKLVRR